VRLLTLPGVLRPPSDCWLLADVMREQGLARGRTVLDVFTGTGALAVAAALDGARAVSAVDISRRAILNARLNARLNGVRVRALRGDLFAPVGSERFDLVLANPPYLPGESDELPDRGPSRAWEGGIDGRAVVDRLCAEVADHLTRGGAALVVHSSLSGERPTLDRFAAAGLSAEVVARRRGPLGPLVTARAELLERRGLLAPGQREEELVVVRAIPFAPRPRRPPSRQRR
jgi:release factor glutamine methyltransferase